MDWSSTWLPAARDALVALRGQGATDAVGLPVPALSAVDATGVLAVMTKSILVQLNRLKSGGQGCAVWADRVDSDGHLASFPAEVYAPTGGDPTSSPSSQIDTPTIDAPKYLAAFPPPIDASSPKAWLRSVVDYSTNGGAEAWAQAYAGNVTVGHVYTLYTPNQYDESGQVFEMRELVDAYQRTCDAIASGALTSSDVSQSMSTEALVAFWSAVTQVGASLDVLADVPPRPPTVEVLKQAVDDAAQFIGDAVAEAGNVAGRVIEQATKGFFEGIGGYGIAVAVGVLAIYLALH